MTDPLTISVVSILGKYAIDAGAKLIEEAGPPAAKKAAELAKVALGYLRKKPDGEVIADGFEAKPDVYAAPLEDKLDSAIQADPAFKEQLATLVSAFEEEQATYRASLTGSGAIAQGPGATAVGERGSYVGGSAGVVVTGDSNTVSAGGDITGRDKVEGDQIKVGDISDSSGVAVGRGASAAVSQGLSGAELNELFAPLLAAASAAPPDKQPEATAAAQALKEEAGKGDRADDTRMANLADRLIDLVPETAGALKAIFTSPAMASLAGPVTTFVLGKIQGG